MLRNYVFFFIMFLFVHEDRLCGAGVCEDLYFLRIYFTRMSRLKFAKF